MGERLRLLLLRLVPGPLVRLVEGFWLTPLLVALLGVGLAVATVLAPRESLPDAWTEQFSKVDVEGARAALSVIAGGMVSLVTLVFSLTFVALSITAQQLSPRILDYVMRERSAQILLGLALSTLLFCLIVLMIGAGLGVWRLGLAMPLAMAGALGTLIAVVLFAHGMTRVMRAEDMVARLGREFVSHARRLSDPPPRCAAVQAAPDEIEQAFGGGEIIYSRGAGYVGSIDYEALVRLAADQGLLIRLDVRESDFLLPETPVACVAGLHGDAREPARKIGAALNLTDRREVSDTAGYEAAALSEAALRALSPGINDPATAISCINRIFEGLAVIALQPEPPRFLAPRGSERAVVVRPPRAVPEFLENVVRPILHAASDQPRVLGHMADLAGQLDRLATRDRERDTLSALLQDLGKTDGRAS